MKKKLKNKFERRIYASLKRAKISFGYETDRIPYILAGHYIPDFILSTPSGRVYVECKGYFRPDSKRKMVAVKRQHPELDIRILFYPFRSKKTEKQYIRWCERNGFRYAVDKIPKEWLEGL